MQVLPRCSPARPYLKDYRQAAGQDRLSLANLSTMFVQQSVVGTISGKRRARLQPSLPTGLGAQLRADGCSCKYLRMKPHPPTLWPGPVTCYDWRLEDRRRGGCFAAPGRFL